MLRDKNLAIASNLNKGAISIAAGLKQKNLLALLKPWLNKGLVAVACSGGLDSLALLHAACSVGLKPIALHIDHGIAAESADWVLQVQSQAQSMGAGFLSLRVQGLSQAMPNLENAARTARHQALAQLAEHCGAKNIFLAHHANDQAETVLLNLLRGTGLGGVGMPKVRFHSGVHWHRPWLSQSRSEILTYAQTHHLSWIEDPSNADTALRRNSVRHALWPVVEAVEPRALPSLLRFSDLALQASQTELALALHWVRGLYVQEGQANLIRWRTLEVERAPLTLQASLLRAWLHDLGCKPPTQAHLNAMLLQLGASTGSGLRCSHDGFDLVVQASYLQAIPQAITV